LIAVSAAAVATPARMCVSFDGFGSGRTTSGSPRRSSDEDDDTKDDVPRRGDRAGDGRSRGRSDGKLLGKALWDAGSREGGGSVEYPHINPVSHRPEPKVSFVERVGEDVCGVGAYAGKG
jgi:hypothetical protein